MVIRNPGKLLIRILLYPTLVLLLLPAVLCYSLMSSKSSDVPSPGRLLPGNPEILEIRSADGVRLSGWFVPGKSGRTGVVLCHGIGASRLQLLDQARFLIERGHPVILFDFRNHGISGDALTTFGWDERLDVVAMADALRQRTKNGRVALWGLSMGAATALLAASEARADGVIAESPFQSLEETLYQHNRLYFFGNLSTPLVPVLLFYMETVGGFDAEDVSPIRSVSQNGKIPMLFVAGRQDLRMPPETVKRISDAHPGGHLFYLAEGPHALIFEASGNEYRTRVSRFLLEVGGRR